MCLLAGAGRAEAAEARRRFAIAPKPYSEALIDLAVQADISLLGASACGAAGSVGLKGDYTLSQALRRLLAGAPCGWRIIDATTVRIAPLPQPPGPSQPPAGPTPLVAELMVTARKRPERLDALPAGVSAVDGRQLSSLGVADIRDTAGQLVGVTMTNLGPGRDKLLMRGLSDGAFTGRARSTVGTYLDDTPINYNAPDPDLRLVDIERVETVRGPQGALYGSGALSGVYRIVSRKPELDAVSAVATGVLATTRGGAPSREVDAYWNLPLARNVAALRVAAYYDLQGGYLDDVALRLSDVDQTKRLGGRVALRVRLSDTWQADLTGAIQRLRSMDTQYTTPAQPRGSRANRTREAHDNDFALGSLALEGDLGWARLTSSTAYVRHDFASQYDASAATSLFDVKDADLGLYSERARIRRVVQDVVLTSAGEHRLRWIVGLYGSTSLERTPAFLVVKQTNGGLDAVYRESRRDRVVDYALYGEANYRLAPGWVLSAGGRAFQTELKARADITVAATVVGPGQSRTVLGSRTFTGFSPKLSLQYEPVSGTLLYALFSEGYRAGGINSTGFSAIRPQRATFAPDRLRNYEIGAKARFLDGRLVVRGAAFYDRWLNLQSDVYRPSGLAYTANVGDARIVGLETEVAYEMANGLSLQANTLLAQPRFTRTNPDFAAPLGSGLPGAPRVSGGVLARYERPLGAGLVLRLVGEASYIGHSRLTFEPVSAARTGAYVQGRLSAELAHERWSAGVFVANPTNDSGDTFSYGNPFTFGQVRQVTPQRPRTIGLRLSAAL